MIWRYARAAALAALLAGFVPVAAHAGSGGDTDHERTTERNGAACGVERWNVKTGLDPDARLVDLRHVVPTTILRLRALTPPTALPADARIRPVETTVYRVDALLLRYKEEQDSDYHLVLADTGGRTMIAEIPAPACLTPASPFYPAIVAVRRVFTAQFQPSDRWQRLREPVQVTGVGFFDVPHEQSGVAPNAVELHPILALSWGGAAGALPTVSAGPAPTASPESRPGGLVVRVSVAPDPTTDGTATTITGATTAGAVCAVTVRYASGARSGSRALAATRTADAAGRATWTWRPATRRPGPAEATVSCTLGERTGVGTARFVIQPG